MEPKRRKWRPELVQMMVFITSLLLFSSCLQAATMSISISSSSDVRNGCSSSYCYSQILTATRTRRQLKSVGGPGSYPPRCTGKCGSCAPCFPVHVPVPPGTPVTTEYYPEAWRCKCGNRLFMP